MKKLLVILLCLSMLPLTMFTSFAAGTEVESGNVLYYQRFNKAYTDLTVEKAGIVDIPHEDYKPEVDYTVIDESGYLKVDQNGFGKSQDIATLPDVIPDSLESYTLETKFRFGPGSSGNSNMQIKFGNGETGSQSIVLRYGETQSGEFLRVGFVNMEVVSAWQKGDNEYGDWVTLKVAIKDGCLYKVSVDCGEASWTTTDCEYKEKIPTGQVLLRQMYGTVEYQHIRIVEGVDYTEYKGQYATTSYSGHTDAQAGPDDEIEKPDEGEDTLPSIGGNTGNGEETAGNNTNNNTDTKAPETSSKPESESEAAPEEKKGCGGSIAFAGVAMIVATGACAVVVGRKRKDD